MIIELENDELDQFLEHHGVKGMKWGVRKDRGGVSRGVDRTAAKDAKEFVRAKQFFGEGAGNRRKLINKTIEDRKKRLPGYATAFEKHVGNQSFAKASDKAVKDRSKIDRRAKRKQRAGALARRFTGERGTQAAFVGVALAGAAFIGSPRGRAMLSNTVGAAKNFSDAHRTSEAQQKINAFLRANGR